MMHECNRCVRYWQRKPFSSSNLNNADREVVESFTGPLPPYNSLHSFLSNLAQLGLTSQKAAVK